MVQTVWENAERQTEGVGREETEGVGREEWANIFRLLLFLLSSLFKFILAYYLIVGGLLVSPDPKNRSGQYNSTLQMLCAVLICATFCSSVVDRWPVSAWRFWPGPFLTVPNAPIITGTVFVLAFHILLTATSRSLYLLIIVIDIIIIITNLCPYLTAVQPVLKTVPVTMTKHFLFTFLPKLYNVRNILIVAAFCATLYTEQCDDQASLNFPVICLR